MSMVRSVLHPLNNPATLGVVMVIVLAVLVVFPWDLIRYRQSRIIGANETQVRQLLGEPDWDSRESRNRGGGDRDDDFILSYNGNWGRFYMIRLKGGSVDRVEQRRK